MSRSSPYLNRHGFDLLPGCLRRRVDPRLEGDADKR